MSEEQFQEVRSREISDLNAKLEDARRTSEYWKAEHNAANAEIDRLRKLLSMER